MKILKIFFVLLMVNIAFSQNITKLLPDNNEIKGWVKSGNSRIFEGERLYEYIDGAAETYHNYGFRQVITQDYKNGNNQIVVDIYEMKDIKNTFGIYSIERDPKYNFINIGNQGYIEGTTLYFWKSNYYIKIMSYSKSRLNQDLQLFGKIIDKKIPNKSEKLSLLSYFPKANLVKNSEKYFSKDLLGYSFFYDGFLAQYKIGGKNYQMFILDAGNMNKALNFYNSFKNYVTKTKGFDKDIKDLGLGAFSGKVMNKKCFAFYNSKIMAGIIGLEDEKSALDILKDLSKK